MRIQCVRVDNYPLVKGYRNLPNVTEGSTVGACNVCRQRIWMAPPTVEAARRDRTVTLICDDCQPAGMVHVSPETG